MASRTHDSETEEEERASATFNDMTPVKHSRPHAAPSPTRTIVPKSNGKERALAVPDARAVPLDFAALATQWKRKDDENEALRAENQRLTKMLAEKQNALTGAERKRTRDESKDPLPANTRLRASPDALRALAHSMRGVRSGMPGMTVTTRADGTINVHVHGSDLFDQSKLLEFAHQNVQRPAKGDKALVLSGKHRGEHVTVLGVDEQTQEAIVKVERMTKAALVKNDKDKSAEDGSLSDDEMDDDEFAEEWRPNELKAGIPLTLLGCRPH